VANYLTYDKRQNQVHNPDDSVRYLTEYLQNSRTGGLEEALLDLPPQGGEIYVPSGIYTWSKALTNLRNNTLIRGAGREATIFKLADQANSKMIDSSASRTGIEFRDITFDANGANQSDGTPVTGRDERIAISIANVSYLRFNSCAVRNARHGVGLRLQDCSIVRCSDLELTNNGIPGAGFLGDAMYLGDCSNIRLSDIQVLVATDTGIALEGCVDASVVGYDILGCSATGVAVSPSGSRDTFGITIGPGTIVGSVAGTPEGIAVANFGGAFAERDVSITGAILRNLNRGVRLQTASRVKVQGCDIDLPAGIFATDRQGIYFEGSGNNNMVRGNHFRNALVAYAWAAGHTHTSNIIDDNDYTTVTAAESGTRGATNKVTVARNAGLTAVADGGTITHNLPFTPTRVLLTATIAGEFATLTTFSSTTFTVAIKKHDGTAGTTQPVSWIAEA